jgi:hypothetical protein
MPNDPNELFAIVPVEGTKSPSDAIIVGNMSAVMECLPQTVARQEAEGRLARQEEDAAEVTRQQQENVTSPGFLAATTMASRTLT